jgi:hypothetical protein
LQKPLRRRNLLKRAIAAAAAVIGGGTLLADVRGTPARAADRSLDLPEATTVEPGGWAPTVVQLTDGPTIAVDASAGNDFRVTMASSRTIADPSNSVDGQQIIFQITQGSAGSAAVTWDTTYEFSTDLPQPTLSTTPGQTDLLGFIYNAAAGKWRLAAFVNGFD